MINKDKNRKKSRLFTKVISLCLTLVMCFSVVVPTQVYGAGVISTFASIIQEMGNLLVGSGQAKGYGAFNPDWGWEEGVKTRGYKVSIWFSPQVPLDPSNPNSDYLYDENGTPVFMWDDMKYLTDVDYQRWSPVQIGNTVYFRNSALKDKKGNNFTPYFWNEDTIYDQTTRGIEYDRSNYNADKGNFYYYLLPSTVERTNEKMIEEVDSYYNFALDKLNLIEQMGKKYNADGSINKGYAELYDFISRMYDMNQENKELYKTYDSKYLLNSSNKKRYFSRNSFPAPFGTALVGKDEGESAEYIKSYFLNPHTINNLIWTAFISEREKLNNDLITEETFEQKYLSVYDFVYGRYMDNSWEVRSDDYEDLDYVFPRGQYKVFIEPVDFRYYAGTYGVMSWRDMMLEYQQKGNNRTPVYSIKTAVQGLADCLALEKEEKALHVNGTVLGAGNNLSNFIGDTKGWESRVVSTAQDFTNTLGVGVVTSASINAFIPPLTPNVIKTYVEVDKIDEYGNVTFKKSKNTTVEPATFIFGQNIPGFSQTEIISGENGMMKAVLNDVITVDGNLEINEMSEWINTDLPQNLINSKDGSVKEIKATAEDIAGYILGAKISSKVDVDLLVKTLGLGSVEDLEKLKNDILNYLATGDFSGVSSAVFFIEDLGYNIASVNVISKAIEYIYNTDVILGKVNEDGQFVKYDDADFDNNPTALPGTLVLRYVTVKLPTQYNYVEVRNKNTGALINKYTSFNLLEVVGSDVNVKDPEIKDVSGTPILKEWVTNVETDIPDISEGKLPNVSPNGKESTPGAPEMHIPNYPNEPVTHNLYAKWVIEIDPDEPEDEEEPDPSRLRNSTLRETVPEWRLSKFWKAYDEVKPHSFTMSLLLNTGHCNIHGLSPVGIWNYNVVNPSGTESKKVYSWIHGESKRLQTTHSISKANPSVTGRISGNVNAIKSTDTSNLRAASWIGVNSHSGLLNYDIQSASKGLAFGQDRYVKDTRFSFKVINTDTYTNSYAVVAHYHLYSHCHNTKYKYITPTGASYGYLELISNITFDRYNQTNTDNRLLTVQPDIKSNNGLTTLKYQDSDVLNVYPEYGMLFDNDSGDSSIKWMVGDQSRKIQPVVYQTMEHKVYVKPTSTGNMATDNRARTSLNKVVQSDNTASGKQVLYKGGPVNTTFQMFRDSGATNKGILTVKTFALDIKTNSNGVNVKNEWGNSGYDSKQSHTSLLNAIDNVGKANVSEKLLVDSPIGNSYDRVVDYTGAIKSLTSDKYNRVKYKAGSVGGSLEDNGTVTVFEHELVVRGGQVIGVYLMNRSSGNKTLTSISDLKNRDVALYTALLNMNLYNESNDKSQTVLSTFEHKTGDTLTEPKYAEDLQKARQSVDTRNGINLSTPDNAKVFENEGWYSEDTTVLVVKEYVTNYEVPSISMSDKLSMSVKGLDTPIDKNQFFSALGKGYTYLKYDLPLTIPNPKGGNFTANSYFETSSLPNDGLDSFGYQGVDYLVPNVSISDTTRMN